jgi:hypothetical protein
MRFSEICVILLLFTGTIKCQEISKCQPEAVFRPESDEEGISYIRLVIKFFLQFLMIFNCYLINFKFKGSLQSKKDI